jgi:uncharacterized repeat protein (TIGR01451 family)
MPALSITKAAEPVPVYSGQLLTYTLTVQNTVLGDATALPITDQVPLNTTYVSCSGDACGESGGLVTWNLALLPAGGTAHVVLTVRVDADLPTGQDTPPAAETPEPGTSGQETATFTVYLPVVTR